MGAAKTDALTDEELLTCPRKPKTYKLFDGHGLFVEVPPKGNLRWRWRYTFDKKDKKLSVGIYPETSIHAARIKRDELARILQTGVDPTVERKVMRMEQVEKDTGQMCNLKEVMDIVRSVREDIRGMLNG